MEAAMEMVAAVTNTLSLVKINEHQCKRLAQVYEEIGSHLSVRKIKSSVTLEPLLKVMEAGVLLVSQCAGPGWFQMVLVSADNKEAFEELHDDLSLWFETIFSSKLMTANFGLTTDAIRDVEAMLETLESLQQKEGHKQSSLTVAISKVRRRARLLVGLPNRRRAKVKICGLVKPHFHSLSPMADKLFEDDELFEAHYLLELERPHVRVAAPESIPPEFAIPMSEVHVREEVSIGQGSTAEVKKADWQGIPCAVKIFTNHDERLTRREVALHQTLRSVYVVKLYGLAVEGTTCMTLMELMDFNLHELIRQKRGKGRRCCSKMGFKKYSPFQMQDAIGLMLQISKGMAYLHNVHLLLHGDLKTDNVLGLHVGCDNYQLKISDFGISEKLSTNNSMVFGKRGSNFFRAPEVLLGSVAYSLEADVYSFAMISYEIMTGRRPFEGQRTSRSWLIREVINGRRPKWPCGMHEGVRKLVEKCWHEDRLVRPRFEEICEELKKIEMEMVFDDAKSGAWKGWRGLVLAVLGFFVVLWWWCRF